MEVTKAQVVSILEQFEQDLSDDSLLYDIELRNFMLNVKKQYPEMVINFPDVFEHLIED